MSDWVVRLIDQSGYLGIGGKIVSRNIRKAIPR